MRVRKNRNNIKVDLSGMETIVPTPEHIKERQRKVYNAACLIRKVPQHIQDYDPNNIITLEEYKVALIEGNFFEEEVGCIYKSNNQVFACPKAMMIIDKSVSGHPSTLKK